MTSPRFEIVDIGTGYVARFVSGDGNKHSWKSRPYQHQRSALVAIYALTGEVVRPSNGYPTDWTHYVQGPKRLLEVRMVEERVAYRPASRRALPPEGFSA